MVSTHSRPKAAGVACLAFFDHGVVSTHSRPKAAGIDLPYTFCEHKFQHTAARRRLAVLELNADGSSKFQHTAARRRLA